MINIYIIYIYIYTYIYIYIYICVCAYTKLFDFIAVFSDIYHETLIPDPFKIDFSWAVSTVWCLILKKHTNALN